MRELSINEVKEVNGGLANVVIGAVVGGGSEALSGGDAGDIAKGAIYGALSGGFGSIASAAKGAVKVISAGMSVLTGLVASS